MITLYPDQAVVKQEIKASWAVGARDVLAVMPTASGKTVMFSSIIHEEQGGVIAIAHRQEIVSQISMAFARNGIRHRIVGPGAVARNCTQMHLVELSRNYIDPNSYVAVAGVDTLVKHPPAAWMQYVTLVVQDEAHHQIKGNKWGKARDMFPQARALGVTATPRRTDGRGLGRHADGFFDALVLGQDMRTLIDSGRLSEYRIFAPPSDLDLSNVPIAAGGDWSPKPLADAVHKSHIVGDVVAHYKRIAMGKRGLTFCVDVEAAVETAAAFRAAGVPAEVVTGSTPDMLRFQIFQKLKRGEILQIVNVDIVGEGTDIPAVEVVSMARPTQSLIVFMQQFGRALRVMEGKTHAIIIDHVSNVMLHGLPDRAHHWSLDRREKRSASAGSDIALKLCPECTSPREAYLRQCPYCGHISTPNGRSTVQQVDGDLWELDPNVLEQMRGKVNRDPIFPWGADDAIRWRLTQQHYQKQTIVQELREAMCQWAGYFPNEDPATLQRRFYHAFGVDVLGAQALERKDMEKLLTRVRR